MAQPKTTKSRLGRGLSALINTPVQVAPPLADPPGRATPAPSDERQQGESIRKLALTDLRPNKYQPRQAFDEESLRRLAESIRSTGMMQPIVVRMAQGSTPSRPSWEIIAGERRWRAAQLAGLTEAPVVIHDIDDRAAAEWALIENLQREDLNPMDRASAFRGLAETFQLTQAEIAERVGLDRSSVANMMRLMELEPEVQSFVRAGRLSAGHAKALLSLAPGERRVKLAGEAQQKQWSVRELEERVRAIISASGPVDVRSTHTAAKPVPTGAQELARQLSEHLGTNVQIKTNARSDKGSLIISFYSVEQFNGVLERIGFQLRS